MRTSLPVAQFRPWRSLAVFVLLLAASCTSSGRREADAPGAPGVVGLGALSEGELLGGFRAEALYLDDRSRPLGARFRHERTGFVLKHLVMDTAPQGYLWVNTAPETDKGLPHAQEHLLLGKGNKGRHASGVEAMSLVSSSAFTANKHTAYHARAVAGVEVYFDVLAVQLDAFLHPDYTDEEIRREFSHLGLRGEPGALNLEEKGTVYVEMVSSYNKPGSRSWLAREGTLYGEDHPKAKSAGGIPAVIRSVEPDDIRRFHREHYRLDNMGMILVLPPQQELETTLERMDALLRGLSPDPSRLGPDDRLPPPRPAPEGRVVVTDYPSANANETVSLSFAWPPRLDLDTVEQLLLEQFLASLAGDVSTNLYRRFIDGQTRTIDLTASSTWAWVASDDGHAITIGLSGLRPAELTPESMAEVRGQVRDELSRIASWTEGDERLADFNQRLLTSLTASRRSARDRLNRPPGFGDRGLSSNWHEHLQQVEKSPGFAKSLTLAPEHAAARAIVEAGGNPWTKRLRDWGLLDTVPYTFTQRPSLELQEAIESSRVARLEEATSRLMREQSTDDPQRALAAFKEHYDAATRELERLETRQLPPFIDSPPMTRDDFLDHERGLLEGTDIQALTCRFSGMSGGSFSLALPLEAVPDEDLVFLAQLPTLMNDVGLIEDGSPLSASEVVQRMQREIQSASAGLSSNGRTARHELVVSARGVTSDEAVRALHWAGLVLSHADWRVENLPRIRDVIDQALDGLRKRTRAREERWVRDPFGAYLWQSDPLFLATSSFLTARHDALRLRWMFRAAEGEAVVGFLDGLGEAGAGASREDLVSLVAAMQGRGEALPRVAASLAAFEALDERARAQAAAAANDLEAELPSLPDKALGSDWSYLCRRIAADLDTAPEAALSRLTRLRDSLLRSGGARSWSVGAPETLAAMAPGIHRFASCLSPGRAPAVPRDPSPLLWSRLEERGVDVTRRVFVGFVEPSLTGGVVQARAPLTSLEDTDADSILDALAAASYSGAGPHGLFMRTWGAGLAYSNGMRQSAEDGVVTYYAERCPTLGETLSFVGTVLREAELDPTLSDYAVAQTFSSRSASSPDARAASMAADIADGHPPEMVRAFREAVLRARTREDLAQQIHARLVPTAGRTVPGLGPKLADVAGGSYFSLGTEAQLAAFETWLREVEDPEARVHRLYPRDFWRAVPPPTKGSAADAAVATH